MARTTAPLRTLLVSGLALVTLAPASGCLFGGYDGVYFDAEDMRLDIPTEGFRDGEARGDLWWLINQTADDTNGWVGSVVETTGYVVEFLSNHRETSRDGDWRVYGPADDDGGRDVAWMVRIAGTDSDTSFEFLLAPRGTKDPAEFELLAEGDLVVADNMRSGNMHIDFDTVENYPQLDLTLLWSFAGDITIAFERDVDTGEKSITIDYDQFVATRTGYLDDDVFSSDETYEYHKAGDGSGTFFLALMGEWDTYPYGWSGPMQERLQLDMVWDAAEAGRARGAITEVDGGGDMKHGDLSLDECFDAAGVLTYRYLSDAYAAEVPGYNFGDESACAFEL